MSGYRIITYNLLTLVMVTDTWLTDTSAAINYRQPDPTPTVSNVVREWTTYDPPCDITYSKTKMAISFATR